MRKLTIFTTLLFAAVTALAQTADEEAIKKTLQAEADAIAKKDIPAWKNTWLHDAKIQSSFISKFGYTVTSGWDSLETRVNRDYEKNPKPDVTDFKLDSFNIHISGDMAWAEYDAVVTPMDMQPAIFPYTDVRRFHNYYLLKKQNGEWKIASRIIAFKGSYDDNEHTIETDINDVGYRLIALKKMDNAIEVLKLNTKLYPESFNTWDSLGEAYMIAGNKKLAIENYEKSLKLNPNSTSGKEALVKLKMK